MLNGAMIHLSLLKDRCPKEIEKLAKHFYQKFREDHRHKKSLKDVRVKSTVWSELANYEFAWPGNVRELMQVINTTLIDVGGKNIRQEDFTRRIHTDSVSDDSSYYQDSGRIISVREKRLLENISKQGHASRMDVERILTCGSTVVWSILKQICDRRLIGKQRSGRNTIYFYIV